MKKNIWIFVALYFGQFLIGISVIYFVFMTQTQTALNVFINRVSEDLKYNNGNWETARYDSDPEIPGRFRLYVFTKDGFVIDRWHPVPGYLDTADFSRLLTFQTPQTISTITNQTWRMYSQPIKDKKNTTVGVITVSYFTPDVNATGTIDQRLENAAGIINSKITAQNNSINADNLDIRSIPYDIAFVVVDSYNTIIVQSSNMSSMNRIPNFIDRSYVKQQIQNTSFTQVTNKTGTGLFLIKAQPIFDKKSMSVGVIIAGTTITIMYDILKIYLFAEIFFGTLMVVVGYILIKPIVKSKITPVIKKIKEAQIETIRFSKSEVAIVINNQKIPLLYATNQYNLCVALFSNPRKKWETDELAEKFGEQFSGKNWRKVYDTMLEVNRKVEEFFEIKLIIKNNKTYQINPSLTKKVVKN